jgi:hypothetical protein
MGEMCSHSPVLLSYVLRDAQGASMDDTMTELTPRPVYTELQTYNAYDDGRQAASVDYSSHTYFDDKLAHLNNTSYIDTLTELTDDEDSILMYRSILAQRVRSLSGYPTGKLIIRKLTEKSTSLVKYINDCYILYAFAQGDSSEIDKVFSKNVLKTHSTQDSNNNDSYSSRSAISELKAMVHSLSTRVITLEEHLAETDKVVEQYNSDYTWLTDQHGLRSKHIVPNTMHSRS